MENINITYNNTRELEITSNATYIKLITRNIRLDIARIIILAIFLLYILITLIPNYSKLDIKTIEVYLRNSWWNIITLLPICVLFGIIMNLYIKSIPISGIYKRFKQYPNEYFGESKITFSEDTIVERKPFQTSEIPIKFINHCIETQSFIFLCFSKVLIVAIPKVALGDDTKVIHQMLGNKIKLYENA